MDTEYIELEDKEIRQELTSLKNMNVSALESQQVAIQMTLVGCRQHRSFIIQTINMTNTHIINILMNTINNQKGIKMFSDKIKKHYVIALSLKPSIDTPPSNVKLMLDKTTSKTERDKITKCWEDTFNTYKDRMGSGSGSWQLASKFFEAKWNKLTGKSKEKTYPAVVQKALENAKDKDEKAKILKCYDKSLKDYRYAMANQHQSKTQEIVKFSTIFNKNLKSLQELYVR